MHHPTLPRRAALALALPALLGLAGRARAQGNAVLTGREGWYFAASDEVVRVNAGAIRSVAGTINEAVGILRAAGVPVVIPLIPSKARLYREFLPANLRVSAEADRRYATILTELRKPGTLVPDLDATFKEHRRAQPAEALFLKGDSHWSGVGSELAATAVADAMKERLNLPRSSRPGAQLGPPTSQWNPVGDLQLLLPPAARQNLPPEPFTIRKPVAAAGAAALVEDDSTDVTMVGNSYMHPRFNFTPMLSSQLARPVSLVWRYNTFGPYKTLLEAVGTEGFRRQRPKALVWTFRELDMEDDPQHPAWGSNAMPTRTFLADLRRAVPT